MKKLIIVFLLMAIIGCLNYRPPRPNFGTQTLAENSTCADAARSHLLTQDESNQIGKASEEADPVPPSAYLLEFLFLTPNVAWHRYEAFGRGVEEKMREDYRRCVERAATINSSSKKPAEEEKISKSKSNEWNGEKW